jgi:Ca2+-transporting ATPase
MTHTNAQGGAPRPPTKKKSRNSDPGAGVSKATPPWAQKAEVVLGALNTSAGSGLSALEAARRLKKYGPNLVRHGGQRTAWEILCGQFRNLVVWMLLAVAVLALAVGEPIDSAAVMVVVILNAAIGFYTELRAVRSVDALRSLGSLSTRVRRAGRTVILPAEGLVPGDIVLTEAGDVLTADLRLVESTLLRVDESTLTGESVAVDKTAEPCDPNATLPDRTCLLHKGTAIFTGSAVGVVVATGMQTELGKITELVVTAEAGTSPLKARLDTLAERLIVLTLVIAGLIIAMMLLTGRDLVLALETGIALAVATIPEGLPVVATIALARGMGKMARRSAIVENLSAVETLGSTSVLLTDKTGTLTENQMATVEYALDARTVTVKSGDDPNGSIFRSDGVALPAVECEVLLEALQIGALCNNATLEVSREGARTVTGDPTEVALLQVAVDTGIDLEALRRSMPREAEYAFDPAIKMMGTVHAEGAKSFAAVKGAPESVLERCHLVRTATGVIALPPSVRQEWLERTNTMAARGQRVLALARKPGPAPLEYEDLELVGLVGLLDPPRASAREAIAKLSAAGIKVVMVTGDHVATGTAVAKNIGLLNPEVEGDEPSLDARSIPCIADATPAQRQELAQARVIGRASPLQKLELITFHQERGDIVAMIGDGVNDAPALRKADIGVAMGLRGTQVAREAADMVLSNDDIATIHAAIEEGRVIFRNIRRFVVYLMSCNVSEVFVVAVGSALPGPLPLLPLHILFLNMVTDVFPALALGTCVANPSIMQERPRAEGETVLLPRHWRTIGIVGALIATAVLGALGVAVQVLGMTGLHATTTAFLTLALAQIWHTLSMRSYDSPVFINEVTSNGAVWSAMGGCIALLVVAVHWAPMRQLLSLAEVGPSAWSLALAFSLLPAVSIAAWRFFTHPSSSLAAHE